MLPQEIIRRKRDGHGLTSEEIAAVVRGIADGGMGDAQVGAFAMAVFLQGMGRDEAVDLTRAMRDSGQVLDWSSLDLDGPILDKHSTGGIGDTVSLALAPLVAACGGYVPMISGRGLGHTGGTLDKLDSIPGYHTAPDTATFCRAVKDAGCAIVGQTDDLAPADRRLYAVRDVTATVESIPLITASILSKKLAAGLDGLVMDVKTGSGAFAAQLSMARDLARSIVEVAGGAGLPATALITDMDQPLANAAGNAVEVRFALDYLKGAHRDGRFHDVTMALGVEMLGLGGLADAARRLTEALDRGTAAERFARMVVALGGPSDLLERPDAHLPRAPMMRPVYPQDPGTVVAMDTRAVGLAVVELGGGRRDPSDSVDPAVGLTEIAEIGMAVGPDRPIAVVHARCVDDADRAAENLRGAVTVGEAGGRSAPAIRERLSGSQ